MVVKTHDAPPAIPDVEINVVPVNGGKLVTIMGAHSGFTRSRKQITILLDDETAAAFAVELQKGGQ